MRLGVVSQFENKAVMLSGTERSIGDSTWAKAAGRYPDDAPQRLRRRLSQKRDSAPGYDSVRCRK